MSKVRKAAIEKQNVAGAEPRIAPGSLSSPPDSRCLTRAPLSLTPDSRTRPWLFSARVDVAVFLGSAIVSLVALWVGASVGVIQDDTPDWAWIPAVLLID